MEYNVQCYSSMSSFCDKFEQFVSRYKSATYQKWFSFTFITWSRRVKTGKIVAYRHRRPANAGKRGSCPSPCPVLWQWCPSSYPKRRCPRTRWHCPATGTTLPEHLAWKPRVRRRICVECPTPWGFFEPLRRRPARPTHGLALHQAREITTYLDAHLQNFPFDQKPDILGCD
jgi:hypothetical protein